MPAPTAARAACVVPKRRCSQKPAAKTPTEAAAPKATRSSGPIQPRFAARTKKKTIPSTVTIPPATASPKAPKSAE